MIKEVQDYRLFLKNIPNRIKKSSIKTSVILEKTGIPKATFYTKLKNLNFTVDEAEKIAKILELDYLIEEGIEKGLKDIKEGRVQSFEEAMEDIKV